jgi:hypothetical protein
VIGQHSHRHVELPTLAEKTAEIARSFVGVRETPRNSNRGPEIDRWVREGGGLDQPATGRGHPYCASYVSACVRDAAHELGLIPAFQRGASVLKLGERNASLLMSDPSVVPCVFLMSHGGGRGHCGFVVGIEGDHLVTIEANTGPGPDVQAKDREGDGVYERRDRRVSDVTCFLRIV